MLGVLLLFFSTNTKQLSNNKTYKKNKLTHETAVDSSKPLKYKLVTNPSWS